MKTTVLLLPGNMCDGRMWEGADRHLPVAIEQGGFRVGSPRLDAGTITQMAADAAEHCDGPLIPLGFSMGGIVALELTRLWPERIIALGLLDTNVAADLPERAANRPRQQADVRAGRLEQVVVEELKPNYLAAANRGDPGLLGVLREMALGLGPEVFVRQSEALRSRPDLTPALAAFAKPVFVACGAEDRLCPPEWHERWAELAPDAELHVIKGAGHMLPLEQPQRLTAHLLPWLLKIKERYQCPTA